MVKSSFSLLDLALDAIFKVHVAGYRMILAKLSNTPYAKVPFRLTTKTA